MKRFGGYLTVVAMTVAAAVIILDSSVAFQGAIEGLELCLHTVIPSLFPLMFFMTILVSLPEICCLPFSKGLCKLFRIPTGSEGLLLTGLLGGYPMGAGCVGQAVLDGKLSALHAERMVVFCNAAGPAFIFGITAGLFEQRWMGSLLWGIQLLGTLLTARMIGTNDTNGTSAFTPSAVSPSQALRRSVGAMGVICGWIILMRVLLAMLEKYVLWRVPLTCRVCLSGILELSNGCLLLYELDSQKLRFLFCTAFLGFGGVCVALQSCSAAKRVSTRLYIPGKILQGGLSLLIATVLLPIVFVCSKTEWIASAVALLLLLLLDRVTHYQKKIKNRGRILSFVGV